MANNNNNNNNNKKQTYFAKAVIIDGDKRIEPGEELTGLKKDQITRLLEIEAITEEEGEEDGGQE